MADEMVDRQQDERPERGDAAIPDSMPDPVLDAVLDPAYDAAGYGAPDPLSAAPEPAYGTAPDPAPAYEAAPVIAVDGQALPAGVNLGATQDMEHVPLDALMPNAFPADAPAGAQDEQAQVATAEQFGQLPDQMQGAGLMQPLPASGVVNVDPVQVKTITVRTGRLVLDVEIPEARFRYTTPRLAAFANGQYPDLPHHACVNDEGMTFGYVMEKTSVAHLLEHLIISEQVRSQATGNTTFVGTTEWVNEQAGKACVEVGFKDDLVALRAFNKATRFLNMAVLTCLV